MIIGSPWRKIHDVSQICENVKDEMVMVDKGYKDVVETERYAAAPQKVYITLEDVLFFCFTAKCLGCVPMLPVTVRHAHTADRKPRIAVKGEAAEERAKAYTDRAQKEAIEKLEHKALKAGR